jgi:dTDP-4-amino-4,6-dideoxygalactose transaminase
MKIPFIDLPKQYQGLETEIRESVLRVLASGHYILGENVRELENDFIRYHDSKYAIGLASGTDALLLSLRACGIGAGDEVIVPAFTFISTASVVCYCGAKPVFADIDINSYVMTAETIKAAITKKTKAVILVHLYGQIANIQPILKLCKAKKILLIEDVAQAIGSEYQGRKAGSFGVTGCYSFYPTKNLSGAGDGGLVITSSPKIEKQIRQLRDHGQSKKYQFDQLGYNSRLDEVQAAILRIKLRYLDKWIETRRRLASKYIDRLKNLQGIELPIEIPGTRHAYNLFTIRTKKRDALRDYLAKEGIATAVHYPYPLHIQKAFSFLGYKSGDFPNSVSASKTVLSLPLYPEMPTEHVDVVYDALCKFYSK